MLPDLLLNTNKPLPQSGVGWVALQPSMQGLQCRRPFALQDPALDEVQPELHVSRFKSNCREKLVLCLGQSPLYSEKNAGV
jgi:hypothetical protein